MRGRADLSWLHASLWGAGLVAVASGLGQFAITTVIGDVAAEFGAPGAGQSVAEQVGLTGTTIGVALAVIRLASLLSLPGAALADRYGRRGVLLTAMVVGLVLTGASALMPGFWWWVAVVALARPWLSTTNAVAGVVAAEETTTRHRSWALAFIAAMYALGSGAVAIVRSALPGGFRPVMALALLPLLALPFLLRRLEEPPIAARGAHRATSGLPGAVPVRHLPALARLVVLTGGLALATGPGFTYVFVYGENILGLGEATMALVVLAAGPVGLVGLLVGRWLADVVGRRWGAAVGVLGTAAGFVATYQGSPGLLIGGYLVGITAGAAVGPSLGALSAEAFPTSVRATVAGWLAAAGVVGAVLGLATFGVLADATGGFGPSAVALGAVSALCTLALWRLPETRGWELDSHGVTGTRAAARAPATDDPAASG